MRKCVSHNHNNHFEHESKYQAAPHMSSYYIKMRHKIKLFLFFLHTLPLTPQACPLCFSSADVTSPPAEGSGPWQTVPRLDSSLDFIFWNCQLKSLGRFLTQKRGLSGPSLTDVLTSERLPSLSGNNAVRSQHLF